MYRLENYLINFIFFRIFSVCQSIDIRNNVRAFSKLRNCRVIEGFLMASLVDNYNESDYANLTFPNLTEITEFLIFYRVNGLRSIGKLFPNLRYIRGNELVNDYALVIYEMMHLEVSKTQHFFFLFILLFTVIVTIFIYLSGNWSYTINTNRTWFSSC